jgi:serine protease Do
MRTLATDLPRIAQALRLVTVHVAGGDGAGSGVIWSADGLIVTNAHVARGKRATVTLADGHARDAETIAWDPERDLAALKIDATGLPAAVPGDSDELRAGQIVVALGHPHGLGATLTTGVIHAVAPRRAEGRPWVQADVRLAPGNSGGPLADAQGRVIGLNAMVAGGLALAVPAGAVIEFIGAGRPRRRALGVTARAVKVRDGHGDLTGFIVIGVDAGSAAAQAGLSLGDVLLGDVRHALVELAAGRPVTMDVLHAGRRSVRHIVPVDAGVT